MTNELRPVAPLRATSAAETRSRSTSESDGGTKMESKPFFSRRSLLGGAAAVFGKIAGSTFGVTSGARRIALRKQPTSERSHEAAGPQLVTRSVFDSEGRLLSKVEWVTDERAFEKLFAYTPDEHRGDA
jgi:hypothetical protein